MQQTAWQGKQQLMTNSYSASRNPFRHMPKRLVTAYDARRTWSGLGLTHSIRLPPRSTTHTRNPAHLWASQRERRRAEAEQRLQKCERVHQRPFIAAVRLPAD